jgi:hypothetical protein
LTGLIKSIQDQSYANASRDTEPICRGSHCASEGTGYSFCNEIDRQRGILVIECCRDACGMETFTSHGFAGTEISFEDRESCLRQGSV